MMATLHRHSAGEAENVRKMALALDWAWESLPDYLDRTDETRRDLAVLIVEHFLRGEFDSAKLCDWVLATINPPGASSGNAEHAQGPSH